MQLAAAWTFALSLLFQSTGSAQRAPLDQPAPGASAAWLEQVNADIRAAEYRFAPVAGEPGTWSAPNRSQELRSRVSPAGLEVFPRETDSSGAGAAWKLRLATSGFGRTGDARTLGCPNVATEGQRVTLDHGSLLEWFENTERGIEQGWTIAQRPVGIDALEIGLAVSGDLALRLDEGGRSGVFVDGRGEARVAYRELRAWDATGRELDARLVPGAGGAQIRLDDARAVYPLTVDPLLTSPAWTAESNQVEGAFGSSVSTAGDVNGDGYSDVIVGAYQYDNGQLDEGRAYVYHGSASGLAASPAWTAESNQASALFGVSVSTAGDVNGDGYSDVIVGAPRYDNGRARVYYGSASGLGASPAWTAAGAYQGDADFGVAVSTAGDVNGDGYSDVIVGAWRDYNGELYEGRAYVYHGSASGLAASPAWTAESNQAEARFGYSVSSAGDVNRDGYSDVIVGALYYDNGQTDEGRAYVYHGSASGLAATPAWTAESNQAMAYFGFSVSTAGDVNGNGYSDVIIGADGYDNGQTGEGRAYVYHGSASGLGASPAWTAESDQAGAAFGYSVASAGDVNGDGYSDVIIGADGYDNGQTDEGRAFAYHGSASGLASSPAWTAESDQANANFGISVATAGDVNGDGYSDVIVGAYQYTNGEGLEGRAFAYHGSASGLAASTAWTAESNQASARFGFSVSTAGDVNGDGYSDVIVGAVEYDNGEIDEGRAFVYHGSASGLAASPAWTAESDQAGAEFGISVSTAGDVNGDGYSDVIVGAFSYDNGQTNEGRAYVYHGSASGLAASPAWTAESNQADALFGFSVSTAGDVNGDGYSDVMVGANGYDNGQSNEGRAYVYHGSASGLAASPSWTAERDQATALFGFSVSTAGDVNGDGYSDVVVGAYRYDNGQLDEGRAFVYHGSASGLAASFAWTAESNQVNAFFGYSVSTAGDVNGDGYSDVIIGSLNYDNGQLDEGRAFVYHGSASGLAASPAWTTESDQASAGFSRSVSAAGDVNGDGYSDVIVGAPFYDNGQSSEGRAYLYNGSASGLAAGPVWTAESDQASAFFGISVATAGDVNGDGYSDVIVGAYQYDNGQADEGRAFVYHGNGGDGGLVRALQQRDRTDTRPIALLGRTASNGLFHLRAEFPKNLVRFAWASPASPSAWLEWELKPLGAAFDGSGIQSGTPQLLEPAGGTLTFDELIDVTPGVRPLGYTAGVSFHWRARVATNNPLFAHTAWFSLPGNNVTEAKLRSPARTLP